MKQFAILLFVILAIGTYLFFMDPHPLKKFRYDFRLGEKIYTLRSLKERRFDRWKEEGVLKDFPPNLQSVEGERLDKSWSSHQSYGTAAVVNTSKLPEIVFSFSSGARDTHDPLFSGTPHKSATVRGETHKNHLHIKWYMKPDQKTKARLVVSTPEPSARKKDGTSPKENKPETKYSTQKQDLLAKSFKVLFETYLPKIFSVQDYDELWVSFSGESSTEAEKRNRIPFFTHLEDLVESDPREITFGEGKKAVKVILQYFYDPKTDDGKTHRRAWVRYQKGAQQ